MLSAIFAMFLHASVDPILGDISWTSSLFFWTFFYVFLNMTKNTGFLYCLFTLTLQADAHWAALTNQLQMNRLSLRNSRLRFKTAGKLSIIWTYLQNLDSLVYSIL